MEISPVPPDPSPTLTLQDPFPPLPSPQISLAPAPIHRVLSLSNPLPTQPGALAVPSESNSGPNLPQLPLNQLISPIFPNTPLLISLPPPLTPPACKDGKLTQKIPLRLVETTAAQRILSHPRVLVNLDVSKPGPSSLSGELEGEVPPMEPRKPCYDGCVGIVHHEIKSPLLPPLQNGDGSINEENLPKSKTMISERKVIKAGLKVLYQGMGRVRKFFVALRKLTKKYIKIAKKVKNYFLLLVVISVLILAAKTVIVSHFTAVLVLVFVGIIIAACKFFYDWSCKTGAMERLTGAMEGHTGAMERHTGAMERLTGAIEELANRMKVIEDKMKEDKNKDN